MNQMKRLVNKNRFFMAIVRCQIGRTIERYLWMFIVNRVDTDIPKNRIAGSPKAMNWRHDLDVSKISLIKKDMNSGWTIATTPRSTQDSTIIRKYDTFALRCGDFHKIYSKSGFKMVPTIENIALTTQIAIWPLI